MCTYQLFRSSEICGYVAPEHKMYQFPFVEAIYKFYKINLSYVHLESTAEKQALDLL